MIASSNLLRTTLEHLSKGTCRLSRSLLARRRLASTERSSFISGITTTFLRGRHSVRAWKLRVRESEGLKRCGKLVEIKFKTVLMWFKSFKNWGCTICISNRWQLKRWGNWFNTTLKTSLKLTHQWTKLLQGKLFGLASLKVSSMDKTNHSKHTLMISLFLKKTSSYPIYAASSKIQRKLL